MAYIIGPDVSFYQDDPETPQGIDFVKMRQSAEFVIIRAGQNLWVDPDFKFNWKQSKLAGFPRGSYWFYDSRADPKRQAELWVQQFEGDFGELPLFADFEDRYNGTYKGWRNWYNFLERLKQLVPGKEIAIYTAFYYWRDNAPNPATQPNELAYFRQYPLWIANYGATKPLIPKPWGEDEWLFWQYTETGDGKLYGVESKGIDLNYFNGDLEAFRKRFKLSDAPPPPPPDEGTPTGKMYRVTAQTLSVYEGPASNLTVLGALAANEIVEEVGATPDRTWLRVRRADKSLNGWCLASFLQEQTAPPDDGTPTGKIYQVTAVPSLRVREGPGTSYASIATLPTNEKVEEIGSNADRSWLRIRKLDNSLKGWCSALYLKLVQTPPEPPPPADKKYKRVTTTALNVREGPGTSFKALGFVTFGEVVEALGSNADKTWVNIAKLGSPLKGWSSAQYLMDVEDAPPPVPDGMTPIAPFDEDKRWYRVAIAPLPVRETPGASAKILGTLVLDDTVPALDESNPNWIQIRRVDGLTGWCEKKNFVFLSSARPASVRQNLFRGVTYLYKDLTSPRKNRMHVMAVDLQTTGLEFLVTPSPNTNGLICTRIPARFLKEFGLGFAVNGDGFAYQNPTTFPPAAYCPGGGEPVKVNGYAASRGKVYSSVKNGQPIVYINSKNQVVINQTPATVFNAVSGDRLIVQYGQVVKNLADATPNPRTGIGLNKLGRWLIFMVIDGRQPGVSEGVTISELAEQLISYGAYTAVNMDGGGSSAMVIRGVDGNPVLLNTPIDQNIPGKERSVANHIGLLVK